MVVKSQKGYFEILKNVREAFNLNLFESLYIEELYDKYDFLVLDIADEKMRIKGFSKEKNSINSFECIMDYVVESCNYLAPFAILRRIDEVYYTSHKNDKEDLKITEPLGNIQIIAKENFDKNTIKYEHTTPNAKNIDLTQINVSQIRLYDLPQSLKDEITKERAKENKTSSKKRFSNQSSKNKVFSHKNS